MFQVGQKVKTRDGRDARIICTDFVSIYCVLAAVMTGDIEILYYYNKEGKNKDFETPIDLVIC